MEITSDFEKTLKRQRAYAENTLGELDKQIRVLQDACERLKDPNSPAGPAIAAAAASLRTSSSTLAENHRELALALIKCTRSTDKKFKTNLDAVWNPKAFAGKGDALHEALLEHMLREGQFDVGAAFAREAQLPFPDALRTRFEELFQIVRAMRERRDLQSALAWAATHRAELQARSSPLEFCLHRLHVIDLILQQRDWPTAVAYAKAHLAPFQRSHLRDIQKVLSLVLYIGRPDACPYPELVSPTLWADAEALLAREACSLLGLPADSPLYTVTTVGTAAMPTIIKMSAIFKDKAGVEWSAASELPVEVPLQDNQRFHSVFACPVSKEQATAANPPMMMPCGHVVCRESLSRLGKNNPSTRFKCPYCPAESSGSQAVRIYF